MQSRLRLLVVILIGVLLSACGTPMPLDAQTKQLDLSQRSIGLLMLEQTRAEGRTMPWPRLLFIRSLDSGESQTVSVDTTFMDSGKDGEGYVTPLRLALAPGKYSLESLQGTIQVFPLNGSFVVPLNLAFEVPPETVFYMGRLHAHMRPRKETEFRAGPFLPLLGQAALNITSSTFDVQVTDASATDLPIFREALPVLRGRQIPVHLLPPHDRSKYDELASSTNQGSQPPSTEP